MPVAVTPSQFQPEDLETPEQREQRTVHDVYERIAPHFSATRYKPWPVISRFLAEVPPNSIGLDSGAGNGKYLPVLRAASEGSWMVALDRSAGLLEIARTQGDVPGGEECVRADMCFNGWRGNLFDFAISIAAVHHLSTPTRRTDAVRSLIRPLRLVPPTAAGCSRFLIYVWAFEQGTNSKRAMGVLAPTPTTETEHEAQGTGAQDVMVPWVLQPKPVPKAPKPVIRKQEKRRGGRSSEQAVEGSVQEGSVGLDQKEAAPLAATPTPTPQPQVFHRYYHLFVAGELRALVHDAAREEEFEVVDAVPLRDGVSEGKGKWLRVVDEGYEKDNWWLEGEVGVF